MADMVRLAGIDVSKQALDVYVMPSGERRTVSYDRRGLAHLRRWLLDLGVAIAAVEASGGYEREVSELLEGAGLVIHRLNPLRVRRFAQLRGRLAKTDRLDARTIAEFARAELSVRLRTVPGVGPVLATTLIALLPELGALTRRQVASLVGVAPFDRSSGQQVGVKSIHAGRVFVRNALYMAAMVASQRNPVIRAFAQRLAAKPGKVRLVACMHKLLVTLNAMVRDGAQWQPRTT